METLDALQLQHPGRRETSSLSGGHSDVYRSGDLSSNRDWEMKGLIKRVVELTAQAASKVDALIYVYPYIIVYIYSLRVLVWPRRGLNF